MNEEPLFFDSDSLKLFGVVHSPHGKLSNTAFVLSHPFVEEKLWSHRVFVSFARKLASAGFPVFRFDYQGAGDSDGDTRSADIHTYESDLESAVSFIRSRFPGLRVGLIGLRLGATVAARFAQSPNSNIDGPILLWEPIQDGTSYVQELLRINLGTQLAVYGKIRKTRETLLADLEGGLFVNTDGYEVGSSFFKSCAHSKLIDPTISFGSEAVLIVQIAPTEKQKVNESLRSIEDTRTEVNFIKLVEQPFWREIKRFYASGASIADHSFDWITSNVE